MRKNDARHLALAAPLSTLLLALSLSHSLLPRRVGRHFVRLAVLFQFVHSPHFLLFFLPSISFLQWLSANCTVEGVKGMRKKEER